MCFSQRSPYVVILLTLLFTLTAYSMKDNSPPEPIQNNTSNTWNNTINFRGTEYTYLSSEPILYYLGELKFEGSEAEYPDEDEIESRSGIYSIKGDESRNILIRYVPDSEWYYIYRKSSLPPFDFSVDNCSRLELVSWKSERAAHATCGEGITDREQIAAFLSDVRSQKTAQEAGLYDLVRKPSGFLENCYISHTIYGFFEEEPHVAVCLRVTSYDDKAYSVELENVGISPEYVLPEEGFDLLRGH